MKGYGMISKKQAGWIEKEKPTAGPLDVIVRPLYVAPCSSDVHVLQEDDSKANLILGHEAIGEIVEIGELVKKFKIGDKVIVPASTPDWSSLGVQGKYNAHDNGLMGSFKFLSQKDGVFAEFFNVNNADSNLVLLPDDIDPEAALMSVDMMSTGFHGAELANIEFGDTVVVLGIGPVGLMAVAASKIRGAGRIIAVGTREKSIEIAKEYGANDIISYKTGDIVKQIMDLTDNIGVDAVIIAGGDEETFSQAIAMAKPGGTIANVNFFDASDTLQFPAYLWGLGMSNKDIRGGFCPGGALRIQKMIDLIRYNRVDPTKLITHRFEGMEKIEDALALMASKPRDLIKPIVKINW